ANGSVDIPTGTTLLMGTFSSVQLSLTGTTIKVFIPLFGDTKNLALLAYYGLPPNAQYQGFANLGFTSTAGNPPTAFTSTSLHSGDIVTSPVDLPSTMLLIGSGLLGFAFLHARRRSS